MPSITIDLTDPQYQALMSLADAQIRPPDAQVKVLVLMALNLWHDASVGHAPKRPARSHGKRPTASTDNGGVHA
jgi:hypothetical protein